MYVCHSHMLWHIQVFFFPSIWTQQQGELSFIQTQKELSTDSKVLFVLRHAGLFELFAVTRIFLHVLLK